MPERARDREKAGRERRKEQPIYRIGRDPGVELRMCEDARLVQRRNRQGAAAQKDESRDFGGFDDIALLVLRFGLANYRSSDRSMMRVGAQLLGTTAALAASLAIAGALGAR